MTGAGQRVRLTSSALIRAVRVRTCVTKLKNFSVYGILTPTSAIADYAIGLERLSANGQLFDDAQTAVSL